MNADQQNTMNTRGDAAPLFEPSRREVVMGGLVFGALFLAGCQNSGSTAGSGGTMRSSPRTGGGAIASQPQTQLPAGIMPRSAWTSAGVARPDKIHTMNGVTRITIHHDGMNTFTSTSQADAARRLESIRLGHLARKAKDGSPWADIGYHYIIDPAGRVWEGRSTRYQGAHVENNNENNLGIMVMGNYDQQRPTPTQTAALDRFVASQMAAYRVPVSRVFTHQEINPTACPGRNLQGYMLATRRRGGNLAITLGEIGDAALLA